MAIATHKSDTNNLAADSFRQDSLPVVSQSTYQRLLRLIENNPSPAADALETELVRAEVVADADVPGDTVVMHSQVSFVDLDSGEESTVKLVFPSEADIDQRKISVLSAVGSALIGLRVGASIEWPLPQGRVRRLQVVQLR